MGYFGVFVLWENEGKGVFLIWGFCFVCRLFDCELMTM